MKRERPILFSTPMVQAILAGRKTMTRRIIKPQPDDDGLWNDTDFPRSLQSTLKGWNGSTENFGESREWRCPYGQLGDILWVRETLYQHGELGLSYVADNKDIDEAAIPEDYTPYRDYASCKVPAIHMQKSVARIWLEVTDIKVERLQDITDDDAKAEGMLHGDQPPKSIGGHPVTMTIDARSEFYSLWCKINGEESLEANPWVWVVSFKVLSTNGKPDHT